MASEKEYRAVHGIVQFEPREGSAAGKDVRNITVRNVGFGQTAVRVSATLWPSHENVEVNEGDVVTLEGVYTQNSGKTKDGDAIKYHNLSVTKILNHGQADEGARVETENTKPAADEDDDDIPY